MQSVQHTFGVAGGRDTYILTRYGHKSPKGASARSVLVGCRVPCPTWLSAAESFQCFSCFPSHTGKNTLTNLANSLSKVFNSQKLSLFPPFHYSSYLSAAVRASVTSHSISLSLSASSYLSAAVRASVTSHSISLSLSLFLSFCLPIPNS